MNQILTIRLDSRAYTIDEEGYRFLRLYLERARAGLNENPDVAEILADIERSISEKCLSLTRAGQTLIEVQDVQRILAEMGPVGDWPLADAAPFPTGRFHEPQKAVQRSRLLKRQKEAKLMGVCLGLAEYFKLDVVLVRLAFVGLAACAGFGIILYSALGVLMPSDQPGQSLYRKSLPVVFGVTMLILFCLMLQVLRIGISMSDLFFVGFTMVVPMGIIIVLGVVGMVALKLLHSEDRLES